MYPMSDIHMHIIPGVDDGAYDMEMAKDILLRAYMQGIRRIIATPHSSAFFHNREKVYAGFQELKAWTACLPAFEGLYLGSEIRFEVDNLSKTMDALASGLLPSMNGTEYVLAEFSSRVVPKDAQKIIRRILKEGWKPIIAHAERYPALFPDGTIHALVEEGALIQVNAVSLWGDMDEALVTRTRELLERKEITFLGSDAHRADHRPPEVEMGLSYLYEHADQEYADAVAQRNAQMFLLCI